MSKRKTVKKGLTVSISVPLVLLLFFTMVPPVTAVYVYPGELKSEYKPESSTMDIDGDRIYYWFDWDDGMNSGRLGPYQSGRTVLATHAWDSRGSYQIRVRTKDEFRAVSQWSDPLPVTMPKNKGINTPFLQFLEQLREGFPQLDFLLKLLRSIIDTFIFTGPYSLCEVG